MKVAIAASILIALQACGQSKELDAPPAIDIYYPGSGEIRSPAHPRVVRDYAGCYELTFPAGQVEDLPSGQLLAVLSAERSSEPETMDLQLIPSSAGSAHWYFRGAQAIFEWRSDLSHVVIILRQGGWRPPSRIAVEPTGHSFAHDSFRQHRRTRSPMSALTQCRLTPRCSGPHRRVRACVAAELIRR
jgi:hypothetical protein